MNTQGMNDSWNSIFSSIRRIFSFGRRTKSLASRNAAWFFFSRLPFIVCVFVIEIVLCSSDFVYVCVMFDAYISQSVAVTLL